MSAPAGWIRIGAFAYSGPGGALVSLARVSGEWRYSLWGPARTNKPRELCGVYRDPETAKAAAVARFGVAARIARGGAAYA